MDAEKFKITPQDMKGKGVSAQSNPMELPEAQAKAVFDQLMKEVMVPRFNVLLEALKPIDLTPDLEKPVSTAVQAALDLKVDKERKMGSETEYKVLSDNNYSDQEAMKVSSAARDRHTHGNKTVLDGITSQDVLDWRGGNVLTKDNTAPYEPTGKYHPATVDYVDQKVLQTGAADMTKAIYDPNSRNQDIFAYAEAVALDAKVMTDDVTGDGYVMGMNNGALYCAGVAESSGQVNVARQDTLAGMNEKIDVLIGFGGGVKSVQRGISSASDYTVNITINSVNPNKCFVVLNNSTIGYGAGTSYMHIKGSTVESLTSTRLSIKPNSYTVGSSNYNGSVSWQVIEFY